VLKFYSLIERFIMKNVINTLKSTQTTATALFTVTAILAVATICSFAFVGEGFLGAAFFGATVFVGILGVFAMEESDKQQEDNRLSRGRW
jgi:hypothetical protein